MPFHAIRSNMAAQKRGTRKVRKDHQNDECEVPAWFLSFTTIGGLTQFHASDISISKAAWLLLFLVGVGLTTWNVQQVVSDYLENKVVTTVKLATVDSMPFPAVTICNYNQVHCSNLMNHIRDCTLRRLNCSKETVVNLCHINDLTNCSLVKAYADNALLLSPLQEDRSDCAHVTPFDDEALVQEFGEDVDPRDVLLVLLTSLPTSNRIAIAHDASSMIGKCAFDSEDEDPECLHLRSGGTPFISNSNGVCYSYNFYPPERPRNGTVIPEKNVSMAGSGLDLTIYIDNTYFAMNAITETEGVLFIVHDQDKVPIGTSGEAYSLAPNSFTLLKVEMGRIVRETWPFESNCSSAWPPHLREVMKGYAYQSNLCQNFCLDDFFIDRCNCSMETIVEYPRNIARACQINRPDDLMCLGVITRQYSFEEMLQNCSCPPECDEKLRRITQSASTWPASNFWPYLAEDHNLKYQNQSISVEMFTSGLFPQDNGSTISTEELQKINSVFQQIQAMVRANFLRVKLFFSSNTIQTVFESPKYNAQSLLSSLGGAFSLYLGISAIAMFEVLELIIRLFSRKSSRKPQTRRKMLEDRRLSIFQSQQ